MSEVIINVKTIIKKLKDILKCDLCKNIFDFNNHLPLITKTGETYCKRCILNNNDKINMKNKLFSNNFDDILYENSFIENLKIKTIINEILNIYDKTVSERYVVFSKQTTERNNNQRFGHYLLTYNNSTTNLRDNSANEYVYNNSSKKINNQKISSLNSSNINNEKIYLNNNQSNHKNDKTENNKNNSSGESKKNTKEISKKNSINNNNNNNINNINNINPNNLNNSDLEGNLNTLVFSDEVKINDNCLLSNDDNNKKKIDDDSIETIPINDENCMTNISFKNEFNEFWLKNDEFHTELINQKEIKNEINKYVFVNKNNLIYKNNQKISGQYLNPRKRNETNDKDIKYNEEDKKKILYQLSEPNFDNISCNKLKNIFNDLDSQKNNINNILKEEEKSYNNKNNENDIKKLYNNSHYYNLRNNIVNNKNNGINDNISKTNMKNTTDKKYMKEYNKRNLQKYYPATRQKASKEIYRKIEEDENDMKHKNFTSIKDNNNNKNEDKNIIFDEDEIKIVVKNISNVYNDEEEKKIQISDNRVNYLYNKYSAENNDRIERTKYLCNDSKIKHTITYNRKILGKTNLSPFKNNSHNNSDEKNNNKIEKYDYSVNRSKYRTISQVKKNEKSVNININNIHNMNNIYTNDLIGRCTTTERMPSTFKNRNNNNNIKSIPKITSIVLKIDNQNKKQKIINKINRYNYNSCNPNNYDNGDDSKNEGNIKNIPNERINSISKAKTFMNKTKDDLDNNFNNLYSSKNLNLKNNSIISESNYLEEKKKEFNILFEEKINNEENIKIKNILLNNKQKYEEIIKNSINSELLKNSLNEIKMFFNSNDFYLGLLSQKDNLPEKGITFSIDGNYYEGTFFNGKKDGKGTIIYKNGAKYEGEIKNNLHNGVGKLTQLDGEIFIGEWKDGKINGNGVRYHSNGDVYSGHYLNSIRDGTGKYIFANGDSYEGRWKNGKANGKGIYKFKNGNIYEGNFENNNFSGQGCFKKKQGDTYIGEFKNGVLNGEGTVINKNNEKYVGMFKNGKKHGNGVLYDKNGEIIKSGIWESNEFISK